MTGVEVTGLFSTLRTAGVITAVDVGVAESVGRLTGEMDDRVLAAIALAVRGPRHGHVCVDLSSVSARIGLSPDLDVSWPDLDSWRSALAASQAVRAPGSDQVTPLVLDGDRLYLDRYWQYEQRLAAGLLRLAEVERTDVDLAEVASWLDQLFPGSERTDEQDRQRLAADVAARRSLTVVTGGPGTGKTTTIVRLVALLIATVERRQGQGPLRVALAAPTGKAAARMQEAIRDLDDLPLSDELRSRLVSVSASTLHRLLGWRRDSQSRFRHGAANPLPFDVIVVDEASMVSLSLMSKLVEAVPAAARLVLVGDREQLVSVEAGAVLGDICGPTSPTRAPDPTIPGIGGCVVQLDRFHRFGTTSGIGGVARAIQRIDDSAAEVLAFLDGQRTETSLDAAYEDVRLVAPEGMTLPADVRARLVAGYAPMVRAALAGDDPETVLNQLDRIRLVCATHHGPMGIRRLTHAIESWLAADVDGFEPRPGSYLGRPVIVTQNDYAVGLFNGDVGVTVRDPNGEAWTVAFPTVEGGVRFVGPSRLPPHETVFATSVHKAQGSQFGDVVLALPLEDSPVLTRELIYTGITRAREHVAVVASQDVLTTALLRPVLRASGLRDQLWLS